jgi:hypothetical protein
MSLTESKTFLQKLQNSPYWKDLKDVKYELKPFGNIAFEWDMSQDCPWCHKQHKTGGTKLRVAYWNATLPTGFWCHTNFHKLSDCLL